MAKLSSGNTFMVGMQMTIHRKLSQLHNCLSHLLHETYRITYSTKICLKIFAIECKIVKSTIIFPFKSFAVYVVMSQVQLTMYLLCMHMSTK